MSIEATQQINRPEDIEKARMILEENEILRNDEYANRVVNNGGMTDSGQVVAIIQFLNARKTELENNPRILSSIDSAAIENAKVTHSVRPDLEEK